MLYGPNSAGKSAVFDAIELLRVLLDPVAVDEKRAADMVDRWARRGTEPVRKLFIAVEFPFGYVDSAWMWNKPENWKGVPKQASSALFFVEPEYQEAIGHPIEGRPVRIEMTFRVDEERGQSACHLVESVWSIGSSPVLRVTESYPAASDAVSRTAPAETEGELDDEEDADGEVDATRIPLRFAGERWLELFEETGFLNGDISAQIERSRYSGETGERPCLNRASGFIRVNCGVEVLTSPLSMTASDLRMNSIESQRSIRENALDVMFYLGTMLWGPMRDKAPVVRADRRSPRPEEALTVVDPGLEGWWSTSAMAPCSPAALLKGLNPHIDEHFKGLAASAHAALLLRTASADIWGDSHAKEHVEPVRSKAAVIDRVNHHLERSLFSEKLYRLECASTLMVPIDLNEDDPWSYYALAQPAAVRLFLREPNGNSVELQDVGSGVSYVLPVLYALSCQGLVQVQQPELHLHPALQASVADVFIEELHREGRGQFLLETHSEHLLLRLLRRIRDTEKGKALSDDVKLTNDDIAVYYFDPQPAGGTFVSRQLVTPLGDFYNDWPRGFFPERAKDLFDEE